MTREHIPPPAPKDAGGDIASLDGSKPSVPPIGGRPAPIVPSTGIAGRSLTFVVAAMCFLACLFFATMISAQRTASQWSANIASEVTIQILPSPSADINRQVRDAMGVARQATGVVSVRDTSRSELEAMLEPWLGTGLDISELPVPRLILVEIDPRAPPDLTALAQLVSNAVPGAILDDHRFWRDRLRAGARSVAIVGGLLFVLVLAVMVASVIFATRGTMTGNREVIEVLHFVGAPEHFIAAEFQRHFLVLGLKAGVLGGLAALGALTLFSAFLAQWIDTRRAAEVEVLIGDFGIDGPTLAGITVIVGLVAGLTALTTRATVFRYLRSLR